MPSEHHDAPGASIAPMETGKERAEYYFVHGENLTDAKTPEAFSFGFPGRAIYGGLLLSLD